MLKYWSVLSPVTWFCKMFWLFVLGKEDVTVMDWMLEWCWILLVTTVHRWKTPKQNLKQKFTSTDHRKSRARQKQEKRLQGKAELDMVPICYGTMGWTFMLNMWWTHMLHHAWLLDTPNDFIHDLYLQVGILTFRCAPPWVASCSVRVGWIITSQVLYPLYRWTRLVGLLEEFADRLQGILSLYNRLIDVLDLTYRVFDICWSFFRKQEETIRDPCLLPVYGPKEQYQDFEVDSQEYLFKASEDQDDIDDGSNTSIESISSATVDLANLFCMPVSQKAEVSEKKMTKREFENYLADKAEQDKAKAEAKGPSVKRSSWSRFGVSRRIAIIGWRIASLVLVATMNCAELQVGTAVSFMASRIDTQWLANEVRQRVCF